MKMLMKSSNPKRHFNALLTDVGGSGKGCHPTLSIHRQATRSPLSGGQGGFKGMVGLGKERTGRGAVLKSLERVGGQQERLSSSELESSKDSNFPARRAHLKIAQVD